MNPAASDDPDSRDMARLVAGEESALTDLMERHGPRLFHYLIRLSHDQTTAADLAQEAFVRIWESRTRFRTGHRFPTWLYTIATNLWRDQRRRSVRHPHVSLDAEHGSTGREFMENLAGSTPRPDQALQRDERAEAVRQAVAALPEELRTPLILAEYEDRSQADIAEILGCSTKAVEMRIYRARQQLRERLGSLLNVDA